MQPETHNNQPNLPNYYVLLGISFKSSLDEIKQAMQQHAQLQTLNLETLKGCKQHLWDADSRAQYDKQLLATYPDYKAQIVAQERELAKKRREAREAARGETNQLHKKDKDAEPEQKRGCMDFVALIATGLVLAFFFHSCGSNGSSSTGSSKRSESASSTSSSRHSEGSASYACKEAVKAVMKAPTQTTVSFDKFTVNGSTYTFFGKVDAPNSFGVMLRSNVSCTATHQSGSNYSTSVSVQN